MRAVYENFPFFCIFLALLCGILTTLIRDGKKARWLTLGMLLACAGMNAAVLVGTSVRGESFRYTMGAFPAPWGNALRAGPVESLPCTVFCLVIVFSLLGGGKDLEEDILPEKQNLYYIMMDLLAASLFALSYTNVLFTGSASTEKKVSVPSCSTDVYIPSTFDSRPLRRAVGLCDLSK